MNRSWVTAVTLATVAGSGAAFTGVIANSHDAPAKAEAMTPVVPQALVRPEASTTTAPAHTLNYQVGAAGVANLTIADGTLTVNSATASAGWTLVSSSAPGAHIDVQFSDGTQLVTFGADLVGTDVVVVSLTNAADPAAVVLAPEPAPTTVEATPPAAPTLGQTTAQTKAQPRAAKPPATAAPAQAPAPVKAATTAPSGSGDNGSDDGQKESNDD
jgi:hypothetical protein